MRLFIRKMTPVSHHNQNGRLGIYDRIILSVDCSSSNETGSVTSPSFGPAKKWNQIHWRGSSLENPSTDSVGVDVYGVDTSGIQSLLFSLNAGTQDFDISSVNPQTYPYLTLKLNTTDTTNATAYQLKYWRINYVACT